MPKRQKGKAKVLNEAEYKRLLKIVSLSTYAKRDTLLVLMSFGTGMRALELASLKISDVLYSDGTIKDIIKLKRTKGNKPRDAFIPDYEKDPRIHDALKAYIEERKEVAEKKRGVFSHSQPLFLTKNGRAFSNQTMQKLFEAIYKSAGIEGASSHSGRRTFATNLIERGADIKAVSTLMGHADVSVTARYVEDNPHRLRDLAAKALY